VSQARAWDATPLLRQADEWENAHDEIGRHTSGASQLSDESTGFWRGDAGEAMRGRHTVAATSANTVRTAFTEAATAARNGYQLISDANTAALQAIRNAELDGYHVADDGVVTVTAAQTATTLALGSKHAPTALAVLDHGAQTHTGTVTNTLTNLGSADTATAHYITTAFHPMHDEPERAEPGDEGGAGEDGPMYREEPPPRIEEKLPDGEEDPGHESKLVAPNVKTVAKVPINIDQRQIQKKYKHASDFGITEPWGKDGAEEFTKTVQFEVDDPNCIHIQGTYRGQPAILNYGPNDQTIVVQNVNGDFVSAWKLSDQQREHVLNNGKLGGG